MLFVHGLLTQCANSCPIAGETREVSKLHYFLYTIYLDHGDQN